jgi:hypothetical protein
VRAKIVGAMAALSRLQKHPFEVHEILRRIVGLRWRADKYLFYCAARKKEYMATPAIS